MLLDKKFRDHQFCYNSSEGGEHEYVSDNLWQFIQSDISF